jgi:hypothetical protein
MFLTHGLRSVDQRNKKIGVGYLMNALQAQQFLPTLDTLTHDEDESKTGCWFQAVGWL